MNRNVRRYIRTHQWAEFAAGIGVGLGAGIILTALVGALNAL